ncbi:MAG: hypothetical protein ACP5D2_05050 [Candidatus Nanoarchaeia archaeon]
MSLDIKSVVDGFAACCWDNGGKKKYIVVFSGQADRDEMQEIREQIVDEIARRGGYYFVFTSSEAVEHEEVYNINISQLVS